MKERSILFSAPMVRAILAGTKTVTRRIVKPEPLHVTTFVGRDGAPTNEFGMHFQTDRVIERHARCPYGSPGDRLWVRETFRPEVSHCHGQNACDCGDVNVTYAADGAEVFFADGTIPNDWTMPKAADRGNVPPIHMPRWASRITLEVVSVRAERLHEITEEDARAEGVTPYVPGHGAVTGAELSADPGLRSPMMYRFGFEQVWCDINGSDSWNSNPWVWRVEFRVTTPRLADGDGEGGV